MTRGATRIGPSSLVSSLSTSTSLLVGVYGGGQPGTGHVVGERLAPGAQRRQAELVGTGPGEDAVERTVGAAGRDRRIHRLDRDLDAGKLHDRFRELVPGAGA